MDIILFSFSFSPSPFQSEIFSLTKEESKAILRANEAGKMELLLREQVRRRGGRREEEIFFLDLKYHHYQIINYYYYYYFFLTKEYRESHPGVPIFSGPHRFSPLSLLPLLPQFPPHHFSLPLPPFPLFSPFSSLFLS